MDGTEALSGGTATATPPPSPDPLAPPTAMPAAMPGAAPKAQDILPPAPPANIIPPSPVAKAFSAVLDLLVNPHTTTITRDDQGVRHTDVGPTMSRGQQVGRLLATALEGAGAGFAAPPGPGQVGRAAGAGLNAGFNQAKADAAHQEDQANEDFAVKQKAKMDAINYQLLQRKVASAALDDRLAETKANQDTVVFANNMLDRERTLGSYDLGTVENAGQIASVISKLPDWEQVLYKHGTLLPVPIYDADGKPKGLQLYLRKQDPSAMPAPPNTQVPKWVPGRKPGEQPRTEYFTPVGASVRDIDNYNAKYLNDESAYRMSTAQREHIAAETKEAGARTVEATANAAKAFAEARKAKIEANNEDPSQEGTAGTGNNIQQNARMMVEGMSSPSLMSKRNKTYDALLPAANAYSLQKYGVPFDAEISEGRYQARKKTIEQFASGKEGDQVQSLNQFFGHAANLSATVDQLRNTKSPWLNVPIKELRKQMGDARYAEISPLIYAVRKEYQNFLSNNMALHNEDIAEGSGMLNDTMSLAQMQGAVKGFGGAALTRAGQLNQRFKRVVANGDVPGLIDDNTKRAINGLGLSNLATQELGSAYTGQQQQRPQQQQPQQTHPDTHAAALAAGVPAGAQPGYDASGKLVGYQDAAGWHNLGGAR